MHLYHEIKVTGGVMKYSPEDHELIMSLTIHITKGGYCRATGNHVDNRMSKNCQVHNLIMPPPKGLTVDHINRCKFDNRRENLRHCTVEEQLQNRSKPEGTSSVYRGIYKTSNGKFCAQIRHNKKHINIGTFDNEIECAQAFDMFVVHKGMFNPLNFPLKRDEYLTKDLIYPKIKTPTQTQLIGVTFNANKFVATIRHSGKQIRLLASVNAVDAANAYDKYIYDHRLPGRKMNFPEKYPDFKAIRDIRTHCKSHESDETVIYLLLDSRKDVQVMIDKVDYDRVKHHTCNIEGKGYVNIETETGLRKLSRYLTHQTDPNVFVDHINSIKSDNRRTNLRITDVRGNNQNLSKSKNCSSRHLGVSYSKSRWISTATRNGKATTICSSDTDEDTAGRRRDIFMMTNYPNDFGKNNFNWTENEFDEWKTKFGY